MKKDDVTQCRFWLANQAAGKNIGGNLLQRFPRVRILLPARCYRPAARTVAGPLRPEGLLELLLGQGDRLYRKSICNTGLVIALLLPWFETKLARHLFADPA
jgi:hypothetical protein